MNYSVFIDGKAGTAGLELYDLLKDRDDIKILEIDEENRKNLDAKVELMKEADLTFLCLPDAAAIEAADAADPGTRIIDTSTAHRTMDDWTYGLPEIGMREKIASSNRVANPGCHATGFIVAARPLVERNIVGSGYPFVATSITGYSGGGKQMIASYSEDGRDVSLDAPGQYAVGQMHKHLPEMKKLSGITGEPVFLPVVSDYYRGMETIVPVIGGPRVEAILEMYKDYYAGEELIEVATTDSTIYANELAGTNRVKIYVHGTDERTIVSVCFDNLGKGAAGAAVQNMNIMLGIDELKGLV